MTIEDPCSFCHNLPFGIKSKGDLKSTKTAKRETLSGKVYFSIKWCRASEWSKVEQSLLNPP